MFDVDLFGNDAPPEKHGSGLSQTWDYPPFSVLNAREGWWQERKRQWLALGIKSELGRGAAVTWNVSCDGGPTAASRNGAVPGGGGTSAIYRQGPGFRYDK